MLAIQILSVMGVSLFYGLYREQRARSWVDEAAAIAGAVSIGTLLAVSFTSFVFKNTLLDLDYSRGMVIYAWLLTILLVSVAAWTTKALPPSLNALGVVSAACGLITVIPGLEDVGIVFGLGLILWFAWVGAFLFRNPTPQVAAVGVVR